MNRLVSLRNVYPSLLSSQFWLREALSRVFLGRECSAVVCCSLLLECSRVVKIAQCYMGRLFFWETHTPAFNIPESTYTSVKLSRAPSSWMHITVNSSDATQVQETKLLKGKHQVHNLTTYSGKDKRNHQCDFNGNKRRIFLPATL